ncbi:putative E3 ubiquitin-protein ligase TRIM71-like isoform X2 [Apostichopus japonicus]|uniref:Putative E3 ubiquitin-protein ligase TRIM71-like isoform X2 n=1 Tax=Stichopus japonicus TaxID=307972 RepID=A0A2G8KNM2_STIJA|nr:putative E3 ubiquitin-protein ligase TRIM71-like isoform X2 [Apostichopus japonicus]
MATMISNAISIISLCEKSLSVISQVWQTLSKNQGIDCENLDKEFRIIQQIYKDLRSKINSNTDSRNSERGLLDAIRNLQTVLDELLAAVKGARLEMQHVGSARRDRLKRIIDEKTKSLHRASETVKLAMSVSQYMPSDRSSSNAADNTANDITGNFEDTVTDGRGSETAESEGHETADNEINNEPPTFKEIPGIIQPHDVITFKNQIFILMDGGINAYNMAGKKIKFYEGDDSFKPFAATFLGNTLWVTDKMSKCVVTFDESFNVTNWFGKDNMEEPAGITSCERENCIYVLTGRKKESARVAKFNADGKFIKCYCSGSLEDPWYIKKSSSDEFFISDFARMVVDVYSNDFSNLLHTISTSNHCRGMDIDDDGNIYIALRNPGYKAQDECVRRYIQHKKGWELLENSPVPWFWENKSLDFVRGLHYYRCQKEFLMVVDAGNKRIKVIPL